MSERHATTSRTRSRTPSGAESDASWPTDEGETNARERIVVTAERMFAERGYDATSTAKVAAEAQVPQGLVFYYFKTKLDLLLAIVRERPGPQAVREVALGGDDASVRELLERAVTVLADELERHRYTRIIIFREAHLHAEIHDRARTLIEEATREITAVLAHGRDAVADPAVLAAVAGLVARSYLVDAILIDTGRHATVRPLVLDLLADACTVGASQSRGRPTPARP